MLFINLISNCIIFLFTSKSAKGFGVHSPFAYNFISKVLNNKNKNQGIDKIEELRNELLKSKQIIEFEDFGAGSKKMKSKSKKIYEIAKYSSTNKKNGMLMHNIIQYFNFKNILELGTSLGIGTSYLAYADNQAKISTIEGSLSVYQIAKSNFEKHNLKNIKIYNSKFDEILPKLLTDFQKIDFAYIDGNHTFDATLRYFNLILPFCHKNSVILFDDISWNNEMRNAWLTIINHSKVTISIDMFFQGIIFVNDDFHKKNYKIRY